MLDIRRLTTLNPSVELDVLLELLVMISTHDGALKVTIDANVDIQFCEHDAYIIKTRIKELFEKSKLNEYIKI